MRDEIPFNAEIARSFSFKNYVGRCFFSTTKYASLLGGIYHVSRDEPNFETATIFGIAYVIADFFVDLLHERTNIHRTSILKEELEKLFEER